MLASIHAKPKTSKMNSRTHSLFPICRLSSSWLFSCQVLPSTVSTTKACKNHFPVLLCTTLLAQNTFQYYFVLQSLQKPLPSTTLYYTACAKHVPGLLCTTKLAQSTSQYYFVLQSLHKLLPSTTVYYKARTNTFTVITSVVLGSSLCKLCSTKQYWDVLCASLVVQSSTGTCFVQALYYKVLLGSALRKLCSTKYFGKVFVCKCICVSSVCVQKLSAPNCFFVQETSLWQ